MIAVAVSFISDPVTVTVAIYGTIFFHALFIVHIYISLQCLIPYSSVPIICYPVNTNLHYVFNHYCECSSFSGGLHASGHIWPLLRSPNVPMIWFITYQEHMVTCLSLSQECVPSIWRVYIPTCLKNSSYTLKLDMMPTLPAIAAKEFVITTDAATDDRSCWHHYNSHGAVPGCLYRDQWWHCRLS